jgi:hypothetical protein
VANGARVNLDYKAGKIRPSHVMNTLARALGIGEGTSKAPASAAEPAPAEPAGEGSEPPKEPKDK